MRTRLNSYTGYSIGCAAIWGVILLFARRRLEAQSQNVLRLVCGGWWMGWTSATIARTVYPPPKHPPPEAEKALRVVSVALIALGIGRVIRVLVRGNLDG